MRPHRATAADAGLVDRRHVNVAVGPGRTQPGRDTIRRHNATESTNPDPAGIRRWIERRVRSLEDSTGDRERGISITAGTVVSGSGFAGGLGYKHLNAFPHGIGFQIDGRVSFRRYQEYAAAVGFLNARSSTVELDTADRRPGSLFNDTTLKRPGSALYVEARYRHYPQHVYYGEGLARSTLPTVRTTCCRGSRSRVSGNTNSTRRQG